LEGAIGHFIISVQTTEKQYDMIGIPEDILLENGNALLALRLYARPGSETVILLHGGPGVPDEMTEVREFLAERMQVITFDQRGTGTGRCKKCTFALSEYVSDINRIALFFNLGRFHLFGHSWGGLYAQVYAQEFPERIASLFLCSPASGTGKEIWGLTEKEIFRYNRSRSTGGEWFMMGINSLLGFLGSSSAYRRLYKQVIINYHKGFDVPPPEPEKLAKINSRAGNKTRQAIKQYPPLKDFGKTGYPVMITYGQSDAYGKSKEYTLNRFPLAELRIVPDCGHTPWKHNKPEFEKILNDFYPL
jgi:proline iminopeptidase